MVGNDEEDAIKGPLSHLAYLVMGGYLGIVVFLSIIGNFSLLLFFASRSLRKHTSSYYMINIAVANLIEAIMCFPFSTYSTLKHRWQFGDTGCNIYAFVCFTALVSNIMTYVAVSVFRYCVVCHRNGAGITAQKKKTVLKSILACWGFAIFWSSLPFFGWGEYGREKYETSCTISWDEPKNNNVSYIIVSFVVLLIVPFAIMTFMYACVIKAIREKVASEECGSSNIIDMKDGRHGVAFVGDIEDNVLKTVVLCMAVFFIAWMPYGIMSLMATMGVTIPLGLTPIPTFFSKTQPLLTSVVVLAWHKDYRDQVGVKLCDF